MKVLQLEVFEKHLKDAFPHHLSPIYAVTTSDSQQRRAIIEHLATCFRTLEGVDCLFAKTANEAFLHLNTASLLGTLPVVFYEGELTSFAPYAMHPSPKTHLILTAPESKTVHSLYTESKQNIVWLDLNGEKPWERRQRLERFVARLLSKAGKRFNGSLIDAFLRRTGEDPLLIEREVEKLLCFTLEKTEITTEDFEEIGIAAQGEVGFQLAEEMVFSHAKSLCVIRDLPALLSLIGQLRYVIEQALALAALKEQGMSPTEMMTHLPHMHPRVLEKYNKKMKEKDSAYFLQALRALFSLELRAKSNQAPPQILLDYFRAQLYQA